MTITHEQYLKRRLMNARNEKEDLSVKRKIDEAIFNAENTRLAREIDSIDGQLAAHGGKVNLPKQGTNNLSPNGDNPFN